MRIVVGITGATGVQYGVRLLEKLHAMLDVSTHLVMSRWAIETLRVETECSLSQVRALADEVSDNDAMSASISSGSFPVHATVILPCTVKTLSAIANGYDDTLIVRAADVALKESRRLVLCPRETPLNAIHLENMLKLARLGVHILPPMPSFYHRPQTVEELVDHFIGRVLDHLGLPNAYQRWNGQIEERDCHV